MTNISGPESALPSVAARVSAFVAIFVGGAAGALIGHSFAVLSCDGSCEVRRGLYLWIGSIIGALGVSVIAVLSLRAVGEWGAIRARDEAASSTGSAGPT